MKELPTIKPEWLAGITMTVEQKQKWLDALRSGRYLQSPPDRVFDADGNGVVTHHCCLAVLAVDVCGLAGAIGHQEVVDANRSLLGAWEEATLYHHATPASLISLQRTLASMHDSRLSFQQIADFIEANIPASAESQS